MYTEDLIKVCKIDNGFVVEVRVDKPKKEESKKEGGCCCPTYEDKYEYKTFAVKTVEEAGKTVVRMLPVAAGKTIDDEFGDAFEEASDMNDNMEKEMTDE